VVIVLIASRTAASPHAFDAHASCGARSWRTIVGITRVIKKAIFRVR